jgi:hypothetical protein
LIWATVNIISRRNLGTQLVGVFIVGNGNMKSENGQLAPRQNLVGFVDHEEVKILTQETVEIVGDNNES